MAMYSAEELWKRWQRGTLTVEQAIGQILQHLLALDKRNKEPKPKQPPKPPTDADWAKLVFMSRTRLTVLIVGRVFYMTRNFYYCAFALHSHAPKSQV